MKFKPTKLIKIDRGLIGGNGARYQYGNQVIRIDRSMYRRKPMAYAEPKINLGDEIFKGHEWENMQSFLKRLRLHLERLELELTKKATS